MAVDFDTYFKALAATPVDEKTEHTDRGALETLLRAAAGEAHKDLTVQHEPKRDKSGGGSPDYMVKLDARIVGYVEVKTLDENLSKVLKSPQMKKYQALSDNLMLTDYLEFIWVRNGKVEQRHRLAHSSDLEARKLEVKAEAAAAVAGLLDAFFSQAPQGIGKGKDLAEALAKRAALLRDFLGEELVRQEKAKDKGLLHGLYEAFRTQVFHELTIKEFADAFGQMLAYGLFLARLNAGENQQVRLDNVRRFIPGSFGLIRELVKFLDELNEPEYEGGRWIVDELLSIVNGIDLTAIHNDLSFRNRKAVSRKVRAEDEEEHRLFERDPFIYFYEDFLKAYDPAMRKGRGVYYTPPPVVNFIVRAIDDILKDSFGIADGLADHKKVTVLDFATGTGTFILEVFERAFANIGGPEAGTADGLVREHLTRNIYGFEYLIAPYTIAHLKLSQYLADKGHRLTDDERLQVYLTNTLEPIDPQPNLYMPELAKEAEAAQAVKEKPILVITGNPPYSGHSKNPSSRMVQEEVTTKMVRGRAVPLKTPKMVKRKQLTYAGELIARYFKVDGKPLGERNPKWLNDDYVKFFGFAQAKMDEVEQGVVGIITNHSWLDNPTFRGMRQSLMRSFDQIYVLDLHGNAKKKEKAPDGSKDENVFDIEQGVAISLFIKKPGIEKGVWRGDLWGKRLEKYGALAEAALTSAPVVQCEPASPQYLIFPPRPGESEYSALTSVDDIFRFRTMGIITKRDALTIDLDRNSVWDRVRAFAAAPRDKVREIFRLQPDNDWSSLNAHDDLVASGPDQKHLTRVNYAPFDRRHTYYTGRTRGFLARPTLETMRHMADDGVGLSLIRKMDVDNDWNHAFAIGGLMTHHAVSMKEGNYLYPAWLDDAAAPESPVVFDELKVINRTENLTPAFRDFIDAKYGEHYSPEEILGYIYAVLHAPAYRARYAEFLRIDFPRIPFADKAADFEALSKLGWDLVQVHLLKDTPRSDPRLGVYEGKGDHTVDEIHYSPEEQAIWINATQRFDNVPQAVWDFHIGGYQVLSKYLKSRKDRVLSLDEQTHVGAVAEALAFTIRQMDAIDAAYAAAFD